MRDLNDVPIREARPPNEGASFYRPQENKIVAGVCAAIARKFGVDVTFVRVALLLTGLVSAGLAFWGYVFLWILTPASPGGRAPLARWIDGLKSVFGPKPEGTPRPDGG